ncbi:MATE family efflux transporter [Luteibacter aegosomatis]|uniref:MATE family efflux transporter n=1 Tax=Luteibacter aegosomatis TaxID=2911537 RepID=UPI001FF783FD|nr:MATE family efflux transporter [Luteibacter aegosomatis]UPG83976.1 MATE family efflux transporter [Luteibacter aegosomatis]
MNPPGTPSNLAIARRILDVSLPLMGSMIGNLVLMLVDRICLARYSSDTLAASGPAVYTAMAIVGFFVAVVGFSRSCVAQAFGRSGHGDAAYQAAIGIAIGLVLAAAMLLLAPLMETIPSLSSRPPALTRLESQFLFWSAFFGAGMTFNMALSSYFNGIGKTRITLVAGLIGQAVGIVMTIGLVFGRFGLPELGMRGSALGTLAGTLAITACYLRYTPAEVWADFRRVVFDKGVRLPEVMPRLRKGFALGVTAGVANFGNAIFIWVMAGLGAIALAANNVNLTVSYLGVIPLLGLGIGCSVLCGNALGKGDFDQVPRIILVSLAIELAYVAVTACFQIVTPDVLLGPFGLAGKPEEIHHASVATAKVLWTYSLAFVFSMTGQAVLESFGITRFVFGVRFVLMWLMSIPTIYLMNQAHVGDADYLPTAWVIGSSFEAAIGLLYFWRIWLAVRRRQNEIVLARAAA